MVPLFGVPENLDPAQSASLRRLVWFGVFLSARFQGFRAAGRYDLRRNRGLEQLVRFVLSLGFQSTIIVLTLQHFGRLRK